MPKVAPPADPTRPLSVGGLAERLGVPRQRIYNEINRGHIKAVSKGGRMVIMPDEAARVLDAAIRVDTRKRSRLAFDWI